MFILSAAQFCSEQVQMVQWFDARRKTTEVELNKKVKGRKVDFRQDLGKPL